ncbi:hypothetical protein [Actinokineospora sp.]|uniref:hypothetical protein n=1 Tax=Actinokineospora sp. TaxID=1872133 RepID=UPI003D6ACF45
MDFTPDSMAPGAWLWVRPRQVQRFGDLAGQGRSKEFIDLRVVREAKRLLAHATGRRSPTNWVPDATKFSKFFDHRVGGTPGPSGSPPALRCAADGQDC